MLTDKKRKGELKMRNRIFVSALVLALLISFTTQLTHSQELPYEEGVNTEEGSFLNDKVDLDVANPTSQNELQFEPITDDSNEENVSHSEENDSEENIINDQSEKIIVENMGSNDNTVKTGYIGGNNETDGVYFNYMPLGLESILILTGGNLPSKSYETIASGLRRNDINPDEVGWVIIDGTITVSGRLDSFFSGLNNLTRITSINKIVIKSHTTANSLFWGLSSLTEISGIESWDVTNLTDMSQMFSGTTSLNEISLNWGEKTRNVQNMRLMFVSSGIKKVGGIETWNVENVTDAFGMFAYTENLVEIDIDWGDRTRKITDTGSMFVYSNVRKIEGFDSWNTSGIKTYKDMFLYSNVQYISLPNMTLSDDVNVENMLNGNEIFLLSFQSMFIVSPKQARSMNLPEGEMNYWKSISSEKSYNSSFDLLSNVNGNPGIYMRQQSPKRVDVLYLIDYGEGYEVHKEVSINSGSMLPPEIVEINEYHNPVVDWYYDESLTIKHDNKNPISRNMVLFGKAIYKTQAEKPKNPNDLTEIGNIGDTVATGNQGLLQIISVPSTLSFGKQKIGVGRKSYPAEQNNPNIQIVDKRREQSGWELSLGMSNFISDNNSQLMIPGKIILTRTEVVGSNNLAKKPSYINDQIIIKSNENPQVISIASETEGFGQWIYSWNGEESNNSNAMLEINTNEVLPDEYTSTLEWTLMSTP